MRTSPAPTVPRAARPADSLGTQGIVHSPSVATPGRCTFRRGSGVLNVAHRGASAAAPENTLAAIRKAIGRGSDLIELDVQRTRDGALVLLHDTTLTRTTNVREVFPRRAPWRVRDFTYTEILRLDAGSRWSSPYAGETIPTLEQAIEVLQQSRSGLLLELKATAQYPGIVPEVAAALRATPGYLDSAIEARRLFVESFDVASMHELKVLAPSVPVGLLGTPARGRLSALATWADQINPRYWSVDASYVAAVHEHGMDCLVWTVNRASAMRRALQMGVDGIITDRPDRLHEVLDGWMPITRTAGRGGGIRTRG